MSLVAYHERPAARPLLRDRVACVWRHAASGDAAVLPDGCMDVVWTGSRLLVAGPDTRATRAGSPAPGAAVAGVRLRPGAGGAALGVAAWELRDTRVDLADVWGRDGAELTERVAAASGTAEREALLEDAVAARVAPLDELVVVAAARVARGERVADVAREVALSERQLRRRFHDQVGYGPKTLGRVMRLQRVLRLARARPAAGLAELAYAAGYADQAHLSADARALTGLTARALIASRR